MNLLAATTFSDSDGMIAGAATGFRPLDWMVVALFLLWMLWIGFRTGRRNRTAEDYVLGGRTMNPVMVGISLFATLLSTLSYLSYPGEIVRAGGLYRTGCVSGRVLHREPADDPALHEDERHQRLRDS